MGTNTSTCLEKLHASCFRSAAAEYAWPQVMTVVLRCAPSDDRAVIKGLHGIVDGERCGSAALVRWCLRRAVDSYLCKLEVLVGLLLTEVRGREELLRVRLAGSASKTSRTQQSETLRAMLGPTWSRMMFAPCAAASLTCFSAWAYVIKRVSERNFVGCAGCQIHSMHPRDSPDSLLYPMCKTVESSQPLLSCLASLLADALVPKPMSLSCVDYCAPRSAQLRLTHT